MNNVDEILLKLVEDGERFRHDRFTARWVKLTEEQREEVTWAAVAGWVEGRRRGTAAVPKDSVIMLTCAEGLNVELRSLVHPRMFKEAAVMGWVQGRRHHDLELPEDNMILYVVLDAILTFPDLYPVLGEYEPFGEGEE